MNPSSYDPDHRDRSTRPAPRTRSHNVTRAAAQQALVDFLESARRVVRATETPTRAGLVEFFRNQLVANALAWTAGILAAEIVRRFFEVRGFRNLWGLAPSSTRTLVSAETYSLIMTIASYCAGLVMLIVVRHFAVRMLAELRAVRAERALSRSSSSPSPSAR